MIMRTYRNLIAVLLVIAYMAVLSYVLTGCAYYSVTKTATETKYRAFTWRDSEKPYLEFEKVEMDGSTTRMLFSADSVDNPGFDDVGEALGTVMDFCRANPLMCS